MRAADWLRVCFEVAPRESSRALPELAPGVVLARDLLALATAPLLVRKEAREPAARAALRREASELGAIEHPAFRAVVASADDDLSALALFEHIEGSDLREHLSSAPASALDCTIAILRALVLLHGRGLAHGDLKPANVLVTGAARVCLVDLGLATPLGAPPRGGTYGFLAPELERGSPASVASELYALGSTLVEAAGESRHDWPRALAALVEATRRADAGARPASAEAGLAMLGATARPLDRTGEVPRVGSDEPLRAAEEALAAMDGSTVAVEGARGSGRTRVVRSVVARAAQGGRAVARASFAGGHDPLRALASVLGASGAGELGDTLARERIAVVLDDSDEASSEARASLAQLARALRSRRAGALIVVGADDALARSLHAGEGAPRTRLEALRSDQAIVLARAVGARCDDALLHALVTTARGRAGAIARALTALGEHPELSLEEVCPPIDDAPLPVDADEARADEPRPRRGATARRADGGPHDAAKAASIDDVRAAAARALVERAPARAAELLRAAVPDLDADPKRDPRAAALLARAEAARGRLREALEILRALGDAAAEAADRLERARLEERLGHYAAGRAEGERLVAERHSPDLRAQAAAVAASAALALGDVEGAEALVARGAEALETTSDAPAASARLFALRSDIALVRGDAARALDHAEHAAHDARRDGDPALVAQALSRIGAAHALGGKPVEARDVYAAALRAAEESGDVAGLAPHLMNLATSEHAIGELGSAIAHYEEAAGLAQRLDRAATRAAALVNLATLLVSVGAAEEAARILDDASEAARAAGSALYLAQAGLVRAELTGARGSTTEALELARRARASFEESGARRQALEAELLENELRFELGERAAALDFVAARGLELESAGLAARAHLLDARCALAADNVDRARRALDSASAAARTAGDRELEARALALLASVHGRLGTGAEEPLLARAREALGEVAARLPAGLRERFLRDPARAALARVGGSRASSSAAGAAARALDPRARRLLALVRRVLLEGDEARLLEAAVDEAVDLLRGERAFLLARRPSGRTEVAVARNLDRETLRRSRFRFSRSVAERVLSTGEPLMTASATDDPELRGARSVLELGLRSILCVAIRGPGPPETSVRAALYIDHRFESGQFGEDDLEIAQALGDIIGVALENARLHREAAERADVLARAHETLSRENAARMIEIERLADALARAGSRETAPGATHGIAGSSPELLRAIEVARRVASSDLPVLVEGESGTGKELLARFVHQSSLRARGPFVAINCGALPETLLESELFGHVRGAFTGATRDHLGLFRTASGGTLLLDEIGEMPARMQTRLLRVLQEREVQPVGGGAPVRVDVRVVAATNRDLEGEVRAKRFRSDLYFRLVGARIRLPPLRDRREDVGAIAQAALERIASEPGMRRVTLSKDAIAAMLAYEWPGNVRELEQSLRRAALVCEDDTVHAHDLGLAPASGSRSVALRRFDRALVEQALRGTKGNRSAAARALGVSRVTLHRWIKRYELA